MFVLSALALALVAAPAPAPELVLQSGHGGSIELSASSPDERLVATAGAASLRIWDVASGLLLRAQSLPACKVTRLAWSGGGREIAAGGVCQNEHRIRQSFDVVLDVATGKTRSFTVANNVGEYWVGAYSPDGAELVTMDAAFSLKTGKPTRKVAFKQPPAWSYVGPGVFVGPAAVAICAADYRRDSTALGTWTAFSTKTGAVVPDFPQSETPCQRAFVPVLSPDGKTLAAPGVELALFERGKKVGALVPATEPPSKLKWVKAPVFSPDGERVTVAAQGHDGKNWLAIFDLATRAQLSIQPYWDTDPTPSGALAIKTYADHIELVDVATGAIARTFGRRAATVDQLTFSPDGRLLAMQSTTYGQPGRIQVWNLATGRIANVIQVERNLRAERLAFADDHTLAFGRAAWGSSVGMAGIVLVDLKTGVQRLVAPERRVDGFAFSPDGRWLAVVARVEEKAPFASKGVVIERAGGAERFTFAGSDAWWAADSARLFVGDELGEKAGQIVRVSDWQATASIPWGNVIVSPDGNLFARAPSYGGGSIEIFRAGAEDKAVTVTAPRQVWSPTFNTTGTRLAIGGSRFGMLIDPATGKLVRALDAEHPIELQAAAFSPDGAWLATGGQEGSVVLRDGLTGEPRVTLLAQEHTDGIALLPTGEYLASPAAMRRVAFRVGLRAYPFEQFDLKFNRPDVVLKALGKAPRRLIDAAARARDKRLARAGFTEAMLASDYHLPVVELDRAKLPASTAAPTIALAITANDTSVSLDRLLVSINDTPLDGSVAGIDLRAAKSRSLAQTVEVPILAGSNRVQVSVLNAQGVESLRETFEVQGTMPAVPGKLYVLAIGVSEYKTAAYNLRYAAKDARDVAAVLAKAPHFASAQIASVLDADATREGIVAGKQALLAAGPNDEVVVFLAGHGLLDDALDYYFATTDVDFERPQGRGLAYDDLEGLLNGVKARRKLLLMDTCNSGELDKGDVELTARPTATGDPRVQARAVGARGLKRKAGAALEQDDLSSLLAEMFADTRRGSGAVVISSAGGAEFALESDAWNNGVFTFALLEGLKSGAADADKNGSVVASELRDLVLSRVRALTEGRQTPTARRENLVSDFVVY